MKPLTFSVVCVLALSLVACGDDESAEDTSDLQTYDIDTSRISVSGVSSGAMMATQLHVAHSALFSGVAMLAGGPYYCAEASLSKGLDECMKGGDLQLAALVDYAKASAASGAVDPLQNLSDDRVWLMLGSKDTIVHPDLPRGAVAFYGEFLDAANITYVDAVPVVHGFPTLTNGAPCDQLLTPFLNACDYDAAGELLQALLGELQPRVEASGALLSIPQPGHEDATMLPEAFLYVPDACANGASCGVHVAFHGCQQSAAKVGDAFAAGAGYNEWAEANRLLVLYPQVGSSKIAPMNPMGCWDWWGYTDDNYATRSGAQVSVVKATLDMLAGRTL
ncbi:MAG: PHB depolymerase family esterase [Woeseiaceae bacterium]